MFAVVYLVIAGFRALLVVDVAADDEPRQPIADADDGPRRYRTAMARCSLAAGEAATCSSMS
jgi:hypothetical protein